MKYFMYPIVSIFYSDDFVIFYLIRLYDEDDMVSQKFNLI